MRVGGRGGGRGLGGGEKMRRGRRKGKGRRVRGGKETPPSFFTAVFNKRRKTWKTSTFKLGRKRENKNTDN